MKNIWLQNSINKSQKQPPRSVLTKRCSENIPQITGEHPCRNAISIKLLYRRTPVSKCDLNKIAKQLYWNRTSAWVFSCKFALYFQSNLSQEHLWVPACENKLELLYLLVSWKCYSTMSFRSLIENFYKKWQWKNLITFFGRGYVVYEKCYVKWKNEWSGWSYDHKSKSQHFWHER